MAYALRLIHVNKAKVKTDHRASKALPELLSLDDAPEGFIYPRGLRPLRDLARRRMNVVRNRSGKLCEYKWNLMAGGSLICTVLHMASIRC